MFTTTGNDRQSFIFAPHSSRNDHNLSMCQAIRPAVAPTTSHPTAFEMPLSKRGRCFVVEGELDTGGFRSVFRRHLSDLPKTAREQVHCLSFQDDKFKDRFPEELIPWLFDWKAGELLPTKNWARLIGELQSVDDLSLLIFDPLWALIPDMPRLPHGSFVRQLKLHMERAAVQLSCQVLAFR